MANYPQELSQGSVCQSHTGLMTGLWFLPARPLRLNTNEWMNEWMNVALTTHAYPLPKLKQEYSYTSTVPFFMACCRVNCNHTFTVQRTRVEIVGMATRRRAGQSGVRIQNVLTGYEARLASCSIDIWALPGDIADWKWRYPTSAEVGLCGAILVLPLYTFMALTKKTLPFIFTVHRMSQRICWNPHLVFTCFWGCV